MTKTAETMWNKCIGDVKDTSAYNCLIILMTWIDELLDRIDELEEED